jgi:hypothetical protein
MELAGLVKVGLRSASDIPVLVTRAHSAELQLEAAIGYHILLCVRIIGAVRTHGSGLCWRRRRWWGNRSGSLLPGAQSWVGGSHVEESGGGLRVCWDGAGRVCGQLCNFFTNVSCGPT